MKRYRVFDCRSDGSDPNPGYIVEEDRPDTAERLQALARASSSDDQRLTVTAISEPFDDFREANCAALDLARANRRTFAVYTPPYTPGESMLFGLPSPYSTHPRSRHKRM